jgi:hypothetical protein
MFIQPRARRTTPYPCSITHDARGYLIVDEAGQPISSTERPDGVFVGRGRPRGSTGSTAATSATTAAAPATTVYGSSSL